MCCGESKGEDHTIKTSLFCQKYLWVSELQKLWLRGSLLWIKLHQVNCHRFLWIRGPRFPTKWHLRRDQINCRELKYSETTSVLKHERGNVNFRRKAQSTSVHPRKNEGKNTKAGGHDRIERQVNVLKELSCEIDSLRRTIEGKKFATKEEVQEIEKWSDEVEAKISEADDDVLHLGKWIEKLKWEDSQKLRERELEYEWTLFKTWLKFQSELCSKNSKTIKGV